MSMAHDLCHCIQLRKASRRVSAHYDEALEPLGINVAQFSLLRNIGSLQPVSLTDLSHRVELDRSTLGRNTKVLARMGLVISVHGEDQREALLTIAPKGVDVLASAMPVWEIAQKSIEDRLGSDKLEQLHALLSAL
ncbi:hypothetical protein RHI9324_05164 [Rhizobium sp. CECT 9324]|nr:hypothetical protein RHI9324_05164 [Rhizobium sp. CECT 9324]